MRVLTFISVVLLTAALASAAPVIWSVDFESGFDASSGDCNVAYGDLSNPYSTDGNDVHVETDPVNTSNTALDVDYTHSAQPRPFITYTNIPSALDPTAHLTVKNRFYYAGGHNISAMMWGLMAGSMTVDDRCRIELIMSASSTQTVWKLQLYAFGYMNDDPEDKYYGLTNAALPIVSAGWHDIAASWVYHGLHGDGKHYARVSISLDDVMYATNVWMPWANDWEANMMNIGCRWTGGSGVDADYASNWIDSQELGNLIDDVVITPEPATALLLLSGCIFFRKRK